MKKKTITLLLAALMVLGVATAAWAGTVYDSRMQPGEIHFVDAGRTDSGNGDVRIWINCLGGDTDERFEVRLERRVYGWWQNEGDASLYCDQIRTWYNPHWSDDDYRVRVLHNPYADSWVSVELTAWTVG